MLSGHWPLFTEVAAIAIDSAGRALDEIVVPASCRMVRDGLALEVDVDVAAVAATVVDELAGGAIDARGNDWTRAPQQNAL